MSGYEVERETLKMHAKKVSWIRRQLEERIGGFRYNPRIVLTTFDVTWVGSGIVSAYNRETNRAIQTLEAISDTLSDIAESVTVAAELYGETESAIEKMLSNLSRRLEAAEYQRSVEHL